MTALFLNIFHYLKTRKALRVVLLIILVSFISFFASKITLEEDIAGFMPKGENSERIEFVYKNIGITDKIIVRFSAKDTTDESNRDKLIEAAELFYSHFDSLTTGNGYVKNIFYKIDQQQLIEVVDFITKNSPYYLDEKDYAQIDSLLTPQHINSLLENNKKLLVSPSGMILKKNIIEDPLHISSSTLKRLQHFQFSNQYKIYNDYIFSKKGQNLLLFISSANTASETSKNKQLVECLDNSINYVQSQLGDDYIVNYFGAGPISVTNAERIKKDSYISIGIALVLIIVLLFWFFRNGKSIILIIIPVVFGALLALAALFFIKGTISAIAIGAGSVIIGIAINYSLHFIIHSKHEKNPSTIIKELTSPMITGSITTVGAFLSLLFISSDSMRDFGLFAAFSLLGTLLFVLIFMPHWIGSKKQLKQEKSHLWFEKISDYRFEKNNYILITVLLFTAVFFYFSFDITFETDMSKINYMKPEQKKAFEELSNFSTVGKRNIYLVSDGKNLNEALRNYESALPMMAYLTRNGSINEVAGISTFLPSDSMQQVKINQWNKFWETRRTLVKKLLTEQGAAVGFKEHSFNSFYAQLNRSYSVQPTSYFSPITKNLANDYLIVKDNRAMVVTMLYTNPEKTDEVTKTLTQATNFIFDSGSLSKSLIAVLYNDFNKVLFFCSFLVLLFLTISFGRIELSIIAFMPMVVSWIWILGIMAIFNSSFNIVNIILATFIFGMGDDYAIFMMDGIINEYAYKRKLLSSYKSAVALSAITMLIGIGTLIFATHPAMQSLGNVTIIGMVSVVVISYVIPPFLFNMLTYNKGKKRLMPITLNNFLGSLVAFVVFLIGSIVLSVVGWILFTLSKPNDKKKLWFHKLLCYMSKFAVEKLPGVKSRFINEQQENFEKPSVIICNHQAHIDLVFIMMLSPKIVILTNEWVWNSPFYGKIVKYADFYPVMNGIENSINHLSELVQKGYSIAIFPEGTRSEDCSINRFHRGAFYLAEKLQIDILPLIIHGIGHALPKTELLLRNGETTMKFLPRITPENNDFGSNYIERTKAIKRLYQEEYKQLCNEFETPSYYSNLVLHNYIYKGAVIEKTIRKELQLNNHYEELIAVLPSTGKMLNMECGWGVFALTCALVKKELAIVATDNDDDKFDIAANLATTPNNLEFYNNKRTISIQDFDFIVQINPQNKLVFDLCFSSQKTLYLCVEKTNQYFESFTTINGSNILYETNNYAIIVYEQL